jgi:mannose-6-phosphate isomerase-like protein (cupin superfamily)
VTGYLKDLEHVAKANANFRQVVETGELSQVVVMSIPPGGEVGMETHADTDQVFYVVDGSGMAVLNGEQQAFDEGDAFLVHRGTEHNFLNTDSKDGLKLITIYAPPHHPSGTVHATKADADASA